MSYVFYIFLSADTASRRFCTLFHFVAPLSTFYTQRLSVRAIALSLCVTAAKTPEAAFVFNAQFHSASCPTNFDPALF